MCDGVCVYLYKCMYRGVVQLLFGICEHQSSHMMSWGSITVLPPGGCQGNLHSVQFAMLQLYNTDFVACGGGAAASPFAVLLVRWSCRGLMTHATSAVRIHSLSHVCLLHLEFSFVHRMIAEYH